MKTLEYPNIFSYSAPFLNTVGVNIGYFDCPGFGDNKGAEQDIANAVFIQQLFAITKEVKIILVAPEVQFDLNNERAGPVLKFINQIADLFPDIDEVSESICLVVTKAEDKYKNNKLVRKATPEQIKKNLAIIKADHEKSNESPYFKDKDCGFTKIFNTLLEQGVIEVFKSPIEDKEEVKVPESIIKMIDSMSYIKVSKIEAPISKDSYEKIGDFYSELQEYAKEQGQKLGHYIKKYINPKESQGTFDVLKIVEEINNLKKFFESKNIGNQENDMSGVYIGLMEKLCNIVGFKNETTIEDELGWMGLEKMNQRKEEMSELEIESLLNRNPFAFILKSIEFISNVKPPQGDVSNFSHAGIDEIRNMIFKEVNELKSGLVETFTKITVDIKKTINELLKNNQDELQLEKFSEDLSQVVDTDDKYLDDYINTVQRNVNTSEMDTKLDQLKHAYSNVLEAYQSDSSSFPIYTIKNSLESSFLGVRSKLSQLHQAKLEKSVEDANLKINGLNLAIAESKDEQEKLKLNSEKQHLEMSKKVSIGELKQHDLSKELSMYKYQNLFCKEEKEIWGQDCKNYINQEICDWKGTHQCIRGTTVDLQEVFNLTKTKNANKDKFEYDKKSFFIVYASKEITVKKDMGNIVYKGGNVVFVAPVININAKLTIDLSGINGDSGGKYKAGSGSDSEYGGTNGTNGLHGESGRPGGNIILIAQEYKGLDQNLRIDVSGGNGRDGQNGGYGGSNSSYFFAPKYGCRDGGKGGDGGYAGSGAQPGYVQILQYKKDITSKVQNIIKQNHGNDGKPGEGGSGGAPWKGMMREDGKVGTNGSKGIFASKIPKNAEVDSVMNHNHVKNDYIKFMTNYAPEAFNNPEEYVDIVGKDASYESFI